jgi:hypothetical protein
VPSGMAVEQRTRKSESIAVIGTHYAAIGGCFLAYNEVCAGKDWLEAQG